MYWLLAASCGPVLMADKDLEEQYRRADGSLDIMKCLHCDMPALLVLHIGCDRPDCPFAKEPSDGR